MKRYLLNNIKNLIGWKTKRKIIVFSVDDYGNVRVNSKQARDAMDKKGLPIMNRFDYYDSLENEDDFQNLFEVLTSVRDKNGNHALFTPFSLPANIDFEKVEQSKYTEFHYEALPETLAKLSGYGNVYGLWKEGITNKLLAPQFHGREHLNLKIFKEKLIKKDKDIITCIQNRSFASLSNSNHSNINIYAAFDFDDFDENENLKSVVRNGLDLFEEVYGFRSESFNAPAGKEHPVLHGTFKEGGVKYLDGKMIGKIHQGNGKFTYVTNYLGKRNEEGQIILVKNCVFEPTDERGFDWVKFCMKQIETSFRWNKPAIVGSHRVNFCGHIDPGNRKKGLGALKALLKEIVHKWPDVEFMAFHEIGNLIDNKNHQI